MARRARKTAPKAAAKTTPKDEVQVTYDTHDKIKRVMNLKVPIAPGHGERIINDAEKHGAVDIAAVRAQVTKHYS